MLCRILKKYINNTQMQYINIYSAYISEELTQETFAIAVKEITKFKGNCKVSVWLCQIAKYCK